MSASFRLTGPLKVYFRIYLALLSLLANDAALVGSGPASMSGADQGEAARMPLHSPRLIKKLYVLVLWVACGQESCVVPPTSPGHKALSNLSHAPPL